MTFLGGIYLATMLASFTHLDHMTVLVEVKPGTWRGYHEAYGRVFYRLAAEHELARREGLDEVLLTLSEHFILAEKAS